ncbi:MAG: hypothetical protein PHQ40_06325 [Anaerolineaceae bacterium]|nr:hypothetical protein [Anaerolineaceae bacterium]
MSITKDYKKWPIYLSMIAFATIVIILVGYLSAQGFGGNLIVIVGGILLLGWILFNPIVSISTIYPLIIILGQISISSFPFSISLERIIVFFAGVGILSKYLAKSISLPKLPRNLFVGWSIWVIAFIISHFANTMSIGSLGTVLGYLQKIAFAWLVFISITKTKNIDLSFRFYVLSYFVATFITGILILTNSGFLSVIRSASYEIGSTLGERLINGVGRAGASGSLASIVAFMEFRWSNKYSHKLFWGFICIWLFAFSLFSLRREVLIVYPLCIILIALSKSINFTKQTIIFFAFIVLITIGVIYYSPEWQSRLINETVSTFSDKADLRSSFFVASWHALVDSPFIGHGPGSFGQILLTQYLQYLPNNFTRVMFENEMNLGSHSSITTAMVETGLLGLIGLCIAFINLIGAAFQIASRDNSSMISPISKFLPIYVSYLFLSIFFGDVLINNWFWFWVGLLIAVIYQSNATLNNDTRISRERI